MDTHHPTEPLSVSPVMPPQASLIASLALPSGQPMADPVPDEPGPAVAGVLRIDEKALNSRLDTMVRDTVEKTLNDFLEAEAADLCGAGRHERSGDRKGYRSGSYERTFLTKAGEVTLKMPKVRGVGNKYEPMKFESQIIQRYRRRECGIEEALVEMYYAGVSMRRVEDITEALWGARVSAQTVSDMNLKIAKHIEAWRNQPITGKHAYLYLDGIWLKRTWGDEVKNVAVLIAVGVNQEGYREILGVMEGAREDRESWRKFLRHLKERSLQGVRLTVSDKCLGLVEAVAEFYPESQWQWCTVHWKRNVMTELPSHKVKEVMAMVKAIHAQEDRAAALQKVELVAEKLRTMKLGKAAEYIKASVRDTLTFLDYPQEHRRKLHSNNLLERLNKEIRRRTKVVGAFPNGESALILVSARCRWVAGRDWGTKRYMEMDRLRQLDMEREAQAQAGQPLADQMQAA